MIPCATVTDMKTTKLHVESVQVQIEKRKNDARVVQTYVDLKNIKWAGADQRRGNHEADQRLLFSLQDVYGLMGAIPDTYFIVYRHAFTVIR